MVNRPETRIGSRSGFVKEHAMKTDSALERDLEADTARLAGASA
jgi:hypothetical protein